MAGKTIQNLPTAYLAGMRELLGEEYPPYLACLEECSTLGLRVNSLKISPDELAKRLPIPLARVPWCPTGFISLPEATPGKHPYHAAGIYYLQDPAAMAAVEILAPQPGERILDLSAAPGGKTTHLAALMENQGLLVANEIHPQRVWELAENLERCGVTHAVVTNETPERLAAHFGAFFDRVLVDAPCSGEGMFRKSKAARQDWSPALVRSCALRQASILAQAVQLVRPGGWLAYTTCTFNPQENESVIAALLKESPEFDLAAIPHQAGFFPARPDWVESAPDSIKRAVRLWPHLAPGEGHFIALLRRRITAQTASMTMMKHKKVPLISATIRKWLDEFCQTSLQFVFEPDRLLQVGTYLYLIGKELPDLEGLKVIHPGWWLGTLKKGRFEPAHALALGLKAKDARQTIDFAPGAAELGAYLVGETLPSKGTDGWVLVCVDGFPLGWGKRTQGVLKNFYPRGLRWKAGFQE